MIDEAIEPEIEMNEGSLSAESNEDAWGYDDYQKEILAIMEEDEGFKSNFLRQMETDIVNLLQKAKYYKDSLNTNFKDLNEVEEEIKQLHFQLSNPNASETAMKRMVEIRGNNQTEKVDLEKTIAERDQLNGQIREKEKSIRRMQQEILVKNDNLGRRRKAKERGG